MSENTTKTPALTSAKSDELASTVGDALMARQEAGYARSAWINCPSPIGSATDGELARASRQALEAADVKTVAMWREFYDYAGAVGTLRRDLFAELDWIGGVDTEDAGDLALQAYERLLTVLQNAFGDGVL
jgi:hypothetical protein